MANDQATGGLADVDAMVAVGGMADDAFVFLVEGIHGWPRKGDPCLQPLRVVGQLDVLPRPSLGALLSPLDGVPGREPQVAVPGGVLGPL